MEFVIVGCDVRAWERALLLSLLVSVLVTLPLYAWRVRHTDPSRGRLRIGPVAHGDWQRVRAPTARVPSAPFASSRRASGPGLLLPLLAAHAVVLTAIVARTADVGLLEVSLWAAGGAFALAFIVGRTEPLPVTAGSLAVAAVIVVQRVFAGTLI